MQCKISLNKDDLVYQNNSFEFESIKPYRRRRRLIKPTPKSLKNSESIQPQDDKSNQPLAIDTIQPQDDKSHQSLDIKSHKSLDIKSHQPLDVKSHQHLDTESKTMQDKSYLNNSGKFID